MKVNPFVELQTLDWNNPGKLSTAGRAVLGAIILVAVACLTYFLVVKGQIQDLESRQSQELSLRADFAKKQADASRLEGLKQQLADMDIMLDQMLRQLPNKTQMANLLVNVSQQALKAGIRTDRFEPQPELQKDFFAERPILLRMVGSYNQFGDFVSGVANLPAVVILTMHDIALNPLPDGAPGQLVLQGTVKTYRYLDPTEIASAPVDGATK